MKTTAILTCFAVTFGYTANSHAFEPLTGDFVAHTPCAAVQSIKKGTNPGRVKLKVNRIYSVSGLNAPNGTHAQIKVIGARPELRWVKLSCGSLGNVPVPSPMPTPTPNNGNVQTDKYLLAISWQPAFCETKPDKTECRSQVPTRFDADHFTLHGLWPQPPSNIFCGVSARDKSNDKSSRWDVLPEPAITAETRTGLESAMPGVASNLHRHEYTKHGTCYRGSAESYFRASLSLLEQINGSKLRDWMAEHVDGTVSSADLKREFEKTFGVGTGAALAIRCVGDVDSRRLLISEIQINLKDPLTETARLSDVLDTSVVSHGDCNQGIVDPVGLN